ncbi:MAG TPA: PrsW family glutamic-type intramembrane protease [Planctomycetota bacterium]|nr:PrsW family glutamic-type intramembrane protease [Planctomycetota bacterium]
MRYVDCSCGLNYDAQSSAGGCPKCGKSGAPSPAAPEAKIRFSCPVCGLRLMAAGAAVGKTMDCLACGKPALVPAVSAPETVRSVATARRPAPAPAAVARPDGWRSIARWSLLAALLPLGFFTFAPDDTLSRIEETKKQYPELAKKIERGKAKEVREVFEQIPSHRIVGAALSRHTSAHWILAILAALLFWEFILIVQPMGNSTSRQLWAVGIFTGTIGIFLLLVVQVAAVLSTVMPGGGVLLLVIIPLKFIGYSYDAAMDPDNGFVASMLGFTLGVGLMEEFFKALPLYWHFKRSGSLDVRGAVVWGLATGIGFGVSEGISYCSSFYNGVSGGGMYVVRFSSCVALHAAWSATAAILIWKRRESLLGLERWYHWILPVFATLWISMILHGFYDTCLKKDHGIAALGSAVLSFALFFWMYDRACREEKAAKAILAG